MVPNIQSTTKIFTKIAMFKSKDVFVSRFASLLETAGKQAQPAGQLQLREMVRANVLKYRLKKSKRDERQLVRILRERSNYITARGTQTWLSHASALLIRAHVLTRHS